MDENGQTHGAIRTPSLPRILAVYGYATTGVWGQTRAGMYRPVTTAFQTNLFLDETEFFGDSVDQWLHAEPEEPFFLFVHGLDMHAPQPAPPESTVHQWVDPSQEAIQNHDALVRLTEMFEKISAQVGTRRAQSHVIAHYDGTIRFADQGLGTILTALKDTRLAQRTVVVVTSDHGEELWEHGILGHGAMHYEGVLNVPLVIRAPGMPAGTTDALVQTADVAPTLLDLAHIPVDTQMDGRSLRPLLNQEGEWEDRKIFSLTNRDAASIRTSSVKYALHMGTCEQASIEPIRPLRSGLCRELFDLKADPTEQKNLAKMRSEEAATLEAELLAWATSQIEASRFAHDRPVEQKLKGELKKHGYWELVGNAPAVEEAPTADAQPPPLPTP